ncbi:MAG: hypothetical protein LBN05_00705 [Oscillospiraceae bacterium]|jgi:hypothetical protein|nr:hypothetical protein [Oscillospiraceae bacterium]
MTNQQLTEALRGVAPRTLEWTLAPYNSSKTKDGVSFMFGKCAMKNIGTWVETVLEQLLAVNLAKQDVAAYTSFLPKEQIGAIEANAPLIQEPLTEALGALTQALPYNPEDFLSGLFPKVTGIAFSATAADGTPLLIMKRGNPFLSGKKVLLCTADDDTGEIHESTVPMLKFTAGADFVLVGGVAYFFSAAAQKDFALEDRPAALCAKATALVGECDLVSDFARFEEVAKKNARKFEDFGNELVENLGRMNIGAREEFISTFGLVLAADGRIDSSTPEQCVLLVDFLCQRACLDVYGRLAVGNKITPRG